MLLHIRRSLILICIYIYCATESDCTSYTQLVTHQHLTVTVLGLTFLGYKIHLLKYCT